MVEAGLELLIMVKMLPEFVIFVPGYQKGMDVCSALAGTMSDLIKM